ncbi:MAG: CsgG/HfaB family protein [Acidobacteriota bacterium]|nr:CsgG/HfaB family protein [Acidobacteriota bacterium]
MRKLVVLAALALTFDFFAFAQEGGLRYTIQVRKFENRAGWSGKWSLGDAWGAVLTDKLQNSGRFIVVAEQDMRNAAMDEQDFAASGRTAGGSKAPKTGQMTPAQLMVKGVISSFDDGTKGGGGGIGYKNVRIRGGVKKSTISGTVYLVDTTTGMVMASNPFEATVTSKGLRVGYWNRGFSGDVGGFKKTGIGKVMAEACDQVANFLYAQLESVPWSATVIRGGDDNIIINRGSREGVTVGMQLRCGKAEEIRDPDTGELLDSDFTETGRIEVVRVKEKLCYAKKISGKAPRKGEKVFQ